jgi:hypothetical protein
MGRHTGARYTRDRANKILSNPTQKRFHRSALRALRVLNATPAWLSQRDMVKISRIYKDARARGLEVDHIVPLSSTLVCGLHVPWNLTVISRQRNIHKSNTFWPDCPFEQPGLDFQPIQREFFLS